MGEGHINTPINHHKQGEVLTPRIEKTVFPIKAEQVLRLNENKDFSYTEAQKDFGFSPPSFEEGIGLELSSLK